MTPISAPTWKWEWNLNTVLQLVGFGLLLVGWGYAVADLRQGRALNASEISDLKARVSVNEKAIRQIDNHELRITNMERAAADASSTMRSLENTLNGLASDMKVTREILQRIEASQKARYQP